MFWLTGGSDKQHYKHRKQNNRQVSKVVGNDKNLKAKSR